MKTRLLGITLFAATASAVVLYPVLDTNAGTGAVPVAGMIDPAVFAPPVDPVPVQAPVIEVVFALDTTGSMGGLIQAAKDKIWSIASTMASAQPAPLVRMGLVAYRDRGDAYVTRVTDLSEDLDSVYAELMQLAAAGGGDGPESVNQALHDAVTAMSWSQDPDAYRVVFLVGDAPPHMDYADDVKYPETLKLAASRGIVVNAIQCGSNPATAQQWQRIAHLAQGDYLNVAQDGNAVAVVTPMDEQIAALSRKLDDTRLFFGSAEERAKLEKKKDVAAELHAVAPAATRARRAAYNATGAGKRSLLGEQELVEAVTSGRVDLDALDEAALPSPLQALAPEARLEAVKELATERDALAAEIAVLSEAREAYIGDALEAEGGAADSFDDKLYGTVRRQAAGKGLHYEADAAPKY